MHFLVVVFNVFAGCSGNVSCNEDETLNIFYCIPTKTLSYGIQTWQACIAMSY